MMVQMTEVGEESGRFDKTLLAVANSFETESEDSMNATISLIQPFITAVIPVVL